jgi:Fe-S-cluster containining protein
MRLNVLEKVESGPNGATTDAAPSWYASGLQFTCTQCGNCCTGGPGFVWISEEEIARLAKHLGESVETVQENYCRRVNGRWALLERRNSRGQYDCIFLRETPAPSPSSGAKVADEKVVHTRRTCAVYAARPLQCRTWPFWKENLSSQNVWNKSAVHCHGMNRGKTWTPRQIEALRDAKDWPGKAPTS